LQKGPMEGGTHASQCSEATPQVGQAQVIGRELSAGGRWLRAEEGFNRRRGRRATGCCEPGGLDWLPPLMFRCPLTSTLHVPPPPSRKASLWARKGWYCTPYPARAACSGLRSHLEMQRATVHPDCCPSTGGPTRPVRRARAGSTLVPCVLYIYPPRLALASPSRLHLSDPDISTRGGFPSLRNEILGRSPSACMLPHPRTRNHRGLSGHPSRPGWTQGCFTTPRRPSPSSNCGLFSDVDRVIRRRPEAQHYGLVPVAPF